MIRVFFALPVSLLLEQQLADVSGQLQEQLYRQPLRWIAEENYHITLAFLGNVQESAVARLASLARDVAARHPPVQLTLGDIRWFPSVNKPRLLVAPIDKHQGLSKLQSDLQRQLRVQGFRVENRKYRPHISLARANRGTAPEAFLLPSQTLTTDMEELVLFSSDLRADGARYDALAVSGLKGV